MGTKRTTIRFDGALHRALRLRAAETGQSVSGFVNEAVKYLLAEDVEDLATFDDRFGESAVPFEDFVDSLERP